MSVNSIAAHRVQNGRFPNHDREFTRQVSKECTSLWRAQSVDTDLARDFSYDELTSALKQLTLRHGKAPGPDNIHADFLLHASDQTKEWLRKFFNKCLHTCKLPRIWRRATVIAILKPNKPNDDPKSYRPISLLCIPYKIVERLIYDGNFKGGAVFVDLTTAYDTVWRRGIILKLLRVLPNRHMVCFISELISNHSVVVKTSDGQQSRLKRIDNGVPQGSVMSPRLFNVYITDLPETNSKKYGKCRRPCLAQSSPRLEHDRRDIDPGYVHPVILAKTVAAQIK